MSLNAFGPRSKTFFIPCTSTASSAVQITSDPMCDTYQFVNIGTSICYFAIGNFNTISAVIPQAGAPANGIPILPNEIVIYRFSPAMWVSAICPGTGTTSLLISVGEGM